MSRNGKQHYESLLLRVTNGTARKKKTTLFTSYFLWCHMELQRENRPETVELLYNEPW